MGDPQTWLLVGFAGVIGGLLALDLGVFHRHAHAVTTREALIWSGVWISCAMAFNLTLVPWMGLDPALLFLTGYLIELSLSVDNLFVFLMLFTQFGIPPAYQHRVLFWGVLGAIVLRIIMITAGGALVAQFHWILYLFGAFLAVTGAKMLVAREAEDASPADHPAIRWLRRRLPVTDELHGGRFLVRVNGRRMVTPLFVVLISVEVADVMFAVDSVPAIFAITTDPFILVTSNLFAIMGLRSMYFALCGLSQRLRYLKYGLAVVLMFIGVKILLAAVYPIPTVVALGVTAAILTVTVVASLIGTREKVRNEG
ncbi:MAG: TerC family protein [Alphaproteobacteria bacterium]|nr:TerC family protein [Alphaproteobacteria bacterium]MBF0130379.1 TerC family protein [Alphaproteobacteria bacterium]